MKSLKNPNVLYALYCNPGCKSLARERLRQQEPLATVYTFKRDTNTASSVSRNDASPFASACIIHLCLVGTPKCIPLYSSSPERALPLPSPALPSPPLLSPQLLLYRSLTAHPKCKGLQP